MLSHRQTLPFIVGLCGILGATRPAASAPALDIPIRVQALAPEGIPAPPRVVEPVSVGVPFAVEDALTEVGTLGMRGTRAAQFRVLQRDPDSNHITWVLATFIAGPDSCAVTRGRGNFGGPDLARDAGDRIVVATGPATFEIRKQGFNGIDRVVTHGDEIVAAHEDGGIVVAAGDGRFESSHDASSQVEIETNGPVMAIVRARGVLRDAAGAASFGYEARLHFYAGQTYCRAFVTLRNADLATAAPKHFDAAWFEIPLRLAPHREVRFGFPGSGFAGHLDGGDEARLFQGDNVFQRDKRTTEIVPYLTPAIGLEVRIAGEIYNALGTSTDVARGWVRLEDEQHAVLAGMRDMASLFPSGFEIAADRLAVEMFSRANPQHDLVFAWGAHETREMLFDFTAAGADPDRFRARLQYPSIGRCDYERYRSTGAICGERRLVTVTEEEDFFSQLGKAWRPVVRRGADLEQVRSYSFGTTGGGNQFDQDECHLIDFLRTGAAGRFLQGRLGVEWKADQAVLHSDDFDFATRQNGISDVRAGATAGFTGKGAGNLFDDEHPHWTCMPLYYHLTGDERIRDAILDYGEWRQYRAGNPLFGALHGGGLQHFRLWSRCIRDVALLWEFTGQERYRTHVRNMARALTGSIERGNGIGRNLDRGYFYFGSDQPARRIHLFFLTEMNAIGVQEAMRVLPQSDPLKEELRDYLYGLAWFTLQEAQVVPEAPGYPYGYFANAPNTPGDRGDQTGILLTLGYELTGDATFVRRSRALAWHVPEYQHPLRASELSEQLRIWRWLHRDEIGAALVEPQAARNADGSWTLRWTVPAGATEYIVKYGRRPLIENLGFDPIRRTFGRDPATAMNFWAATNVAGEPTPGAAGTQETWRTPVLPPGDWHFKVKILGDRPLGSPAAVGMSSGNAPRRSGTGVATETDVQRVDSRSAR